MPPPPKRGRPNAGRSRSRRARPGSSPSATCARVPSSASPPASARAAWRSPTCTSTSRCCGGPSPCDPGGAEMTTAAPPPFDRELEPALAMLPAFFTTLEPDAIPEFRRALAAPPAIDDVIAGRPVEVRDHVVRGHGEDDLTVSVLRRSDHVGHGHPAAFLIHGGGMVAGSRWSLGAMLVDWVLEHELVAAT